MRATRVQHEFVELIPDDLADTTLFISIPYATAVHLCLCGCGHRVVTPLSPTDWRLIFDGETVSLEPSIGNWSFDCQSHYWIENGRVHWAGRWSQARIDIGRDCDRQAKRQYLGELAASPGAQRRPATAPVSTGAVRRWLARLGR